MESETQKLLEELLKKVEALEQNALKILQERKELRHMIKSMYTWQKGMADKIKSYEKIINQESNGKTDSQSEKDAERETTGIRKETSRKDI